MKNYDNHPRFDKTSDQYQLSMLRKLAGWLSRHPKPNELIKDEVNALNWALEKLGGAEEEAPAYPKGKVDEDAEEVPEAE